MNINGLVIKTDSTQKEKLVKLKKVQYKNDYDVQTHWIAYQESFEYPFKQTNRSFRILGNEILKSSKFLRYIWNEVQKTNSITRDLLYILLFILLLIGGRR